MVRLIDADELMKTLMHEGLGYQYNRVMCAPTVDAVPVIRCRDCKYYTGKWCTKFSTKQFDINDICKDDNDYCSMAERKEEWTK